MIDILGINTLMIEQEFKCYEELVDICEDLPFVYNGEVTIGKNYDHDLGEYINEDIYMGKLSQDFYESPSIGTYQKLIPFLNKAGWYATSTLPTYSDNKYILGDEYLYKIDNMGKVLETHLLANRSISDSNRVGVRDSNICS
jgi:hypothetical protein